ncbi:MAG: penicillin-binding protein 1A, partial [Myxococcota bacterium]
MTTDPSTPKTSPLRITVANRRRGGWPLTVIRGLLAFVAWGGLLAGVGLFVIYTVMAQDLPRIDGFDDASASTVTRFLAADGQLVGEWSNERRLEARWEELPRPLVLAFLAAEDERFFEHSGVDLKGVARAMVKNLQSGSSEEGASTITQQLAKTLVGSEKSYVRKVKEAILARRMEDLYAKPKILTWYMNVIFLGHGSYGVKAASQNYFRKRLDELELGEMALLAAMAQSPGRVNARIDMPGTRRRMAHILRNMQRLGWVTEAEVDAALAKEFVAFPLRDRLGDHTPYYTGAVLADVGRRYAIAPTQDDPTNGWLARGLTVSMAVDPAMQRAGSEALKRGLERVARWQGYPGALGSLDRKTFLARNGTYASITVGTRTLARVAAVQKGELTVDLTATTTATMHVSMTRWAIPYTVLGKKRDAKVSFKGRIRDMRKPFAVGDILYVEITHEGRTKRGEGLEVELVPIPKVEGALLSYGVETGGIDAMVGGWDFDRSEVNRVESLRQTGSTMKPLVYAKAYDLGLAPSQLFSGAPFRDGKYNPTGVKGKDDKLVWDALAESVNSVSLRVQNYVLSHTTLKDYRAWGRALQLAKPLTGYTSEILGANQTPTSMSAAFGIFARQGRAPQMHRIRKVVDATGAVLERHMTPLDPHAGYGDALIALWEHGLRPPKQQIPGDTAFLMAHNLTEVIKRGTAKKAKKLDRDAAGKTGTLAFDVWFNGFTADRVATVWVGADRMERPVGLSV